MPPMSALFIGHLPVYDYIWKEQLFLIPNQTIVKVLCIDQNEI